MQAGSGHAGLPFGCAEIGACLFGNFLRLSPTNPNWLGRDRVVLSAGHGSLLLYSCLHLLGFGISFEDILKYRQFGSNTPSHPDIRKTIGIEATTGLDGQGVGLGIGIALGMKFTQKRFEFEEYSLFDSKCITIAGDGCLMEGVSAESSSLAGHLGLDNLIVIYDSNKTSLDGYTDESVSEDIRKRYQAYAWDVFEFDGHDISSISECLHKLRLEQERPVLIIANTITGRGIPDVAGTPDAHGNPYLLRSVVAKLNVPKSNSSECLKPSLKNFLDSYKEVLKSGEDKWTERYQKWKGKNPKLERDLNQSLCFDIPANLEVELLKLDFQRSISGRLASNYVMNSIASKLPSIYVGSADLSKSDMTYLKNYSDVSKNQFEGRNIKYGVREFGMCTIATGLALTNLIIPVIGTFLAFCDYMISPIRMAALMNQKIILQLTHDSFYVGHDGPTHQPLEQMAHLRAIPNVQVIRPADANEVKMAWIAALSHQGPTAIILSRQDLPVMDETNRPYCEGVGRGAYIIEEDSLVVDVLLIATGSELALARLVAKSLREKNKKVRVVSMPSQELFDKEEVTYKNRILLNAEKCVSIEAGIEQGWSKYVGRGGIVISADDFGESGSPEDLALHYGFVCEVICQRILPC